MELSIKPSEIIFLNFETHIGIGSPKFQYGLLLSYRPSTQDSGVALKAGAGQSYGQRCQNRLYTSYTIGLYDKFYVNKSMKFFIQNEVFYRDWFFNKKYAEYSNVEKTLEEYKGLRTENINVYCLKALLGYTVLFKAKQERKIKFYMDLFAGIGIRDQEGTYETYNGTVANVYYTYKKDKDHYVWVTPQFGINIGICRLNNGS
jgi:hypothetical protein